MGDILSQGKVVPPDCVLPALASKGWDLELRTEDACLSFGPVHEVIIVMLGWPEARNERIPEAQLAGWVCRHHHTEGTLG